MRKLCVKLVHFSPTLVQNLCTKCMHILNNFQYPQKLCSYAQRFTYDVLRVMHTTLMRCTEVRGHFSSLSTVLIKNSNMDIKNFVTESCGRNV